MECCDDVEQEVDLHWHHTVVHVYQEAEGGVYQEAEGGVYQEAECCVYQEAEGGEDS